MRVRRIVASMAVATIGLSGCSRQHMVTTQNEARDRIAAGPALNAATGAYRVGDVVIKLTRVVRLPGGQMGMEFVMSSASGSLAGCCDVFPHTALEQPPPQSATSNTFRLDIAIPTSSVNPDGTIEMRLIGHKPASVLGSFSVDLTSLGVKV